MTERITISLVLLFGLLLPVLGQDVDSLYVQNELVVDTIQTQSEIKTQTKIQTSDTIAWVDGELSLDKKTEQVLESKMEFKPNPTKAVIYSAIFPGLGQIYNKKYWKLPIIYGGFIGLSYAVSWNGRYYNDYSDAYKAIMKEDPRAPENFNVWGSFIPGVTDPQSVSNAQIRTWQNSFKRNRDSYRRYRDLSIIGMVALYALCMVDAYVDANLFDFDISPDLSLKVEPTTINNDRLINKSYGVQCSIKF